MKIFVKFFIKGGILAPTDLNRIVEIHEKLGGDHLQFTDRQEIKIRIEDSKKHLIPSISNGLKYEIAGKDGSFKYSNIVSSFLSKKIDQSTYWVKQGSYLDILDHVSDFYKLKINITDLKQDFVFSFTGDINFVASEEVNYWFMYIRDVHKQNFKLVPFMIYSEDVVQVADYLEENFDLETTSIDDIQNQIKELIGFRAQVFSVSPMIKVSEYRNYEGIHIYGEDKYWLGIYRRNDRFSNYLLKSLVELCKSQMIGQIHITPWKSIIVKDINSFSITDWRLFLTEHNINVGHSEAELNWQLNDLDESAKEVKAFLRKEFAQNDMSINGAIFGINVDRKTTFAHVLIKKNSFLKFMGRSEVSTYTVYYRKEFSPIKTTFEVYNKMVLKTNLVKAVKSVLDMYHNKAYREVASFIPKKVEPLKEIQSLDVQDESVHRCKKCLTVYYPEYGDVNVEPGVLFEDLPDNYHCSVCESSKSDFESVNLSEVV